MAAFNLMQEIKKYSGIIVMVRASNHSYSEIASLKCPVVSFQGCKMSRCVFLKVKISQGPCERNILSNQNWTSSRTSEKLSSQ